MTTLVARARQAVFGKSDWPLIERYIVGDLTPAEQDSFEDRLENDELFFERAMPLINFFRFGPPPEVDPVVAAAKARTAEEAFWHRMLEALQLPQEPYQPALFHRMPRVMWGARIARAIDMHLLPLSTATVSILVLAVVGFFGVPRLQSAVGSWRDARQGRADWRWIPRASELETNAFQSNRVVMADSSVIELAPASRIHYQGLGRPAGGLTQAAVAIDGDVTLIVPPSKAYVTLRTHEIDGMLMPGTYRIHAVPKSGLTTIDVASGEALVRGLHQQENSQETISAGQHAVFAGSGRK